MHRAVWVHTRTGAYVALVLLCMGGLAACNGSDPEEAAVVIIESTPEEGADIVIGGRPYGQTPRTIRNLPAGQYFAILTMYGFKRGTQAFIVPDSGGEVRVTVDMEPIVGYLSVDSEPPRAEVYLTVGETERFLGRTPVGNVAVPVGTVEYEIRLEDYEPLQASVGVEPEYTYRKTHQLKPLRGWLQVFSRPSGAQIYVEGEEQREVTPASFQLRPGTYTIGTYKEGYISAERTVTVEPNGEHSIDLLMKEGFMPRGMVLVPAGEFTMGKAGGAPDEQPRRKVTVDAFYIDKYEVTNAEFAEVFPEHRFDKRETRFPVTGVTWQQARAYAEAVGKRLPTEVEWEKAARGVDAREYPWGNTFNPDLCNSSEARENGPVRVGSYRNAVSPYGAMDMAGNVYEWTSDWYEPYPGNEIISVEYGQVYRVLRGGSYMTDQFGVRCARRHYARPDAARADYGFRCAMDARLVAD